MKILWIGDNPLLPTGFGNEIEQLIKGLNEYEHAVAALRHKGIKFQFEDFDLYPINNLNIYLSELKDTDAVITVGGATMFKQGNNIADALNAEWLALYRIDGRPMPKNHARFLIGQNGTTIVPSDWLSQECEKKFVDYEQIHQGIDFSLWKPESLDKDRITYGCTMRNIAPRKNYDLLLKAWKEFSEGKKDVELLLRCNPQDSTGWPLKALIQEMNISKVRFATMNTYEGIPYEEMPQIYKQIDVFITATGGEAFGRPFLEAQAMKIPVIAPDYTSVKELIPAELRVEIKDKMISQGHTYWLVRPKVDDLIAKMEMFHENRDLIEDFGNKGYERIQDYDKDSMIKEWRDLLDAKTS